MSTFQNKIFFNQILFILRVQTFIKFEDKGLAGAPDLIIEILSFSTSQLDYEEKNCYMKNLVFRNIL